MPVKADLTYRLVPGFGPLYFPTLLRDTQETEIDYGQAVWQELHT
jgi:hypothetical protein